MGKSTISMAIFNSYVSHYQRVLIPPGGMRFEPWRKWVTRWPPRSGAVEAWDRGKNGHSSHIMGMLMMGIELIIIDHHPTIWIYIYIYIYIYIPRYGATVYIHICMYIYIYTYTIYIYIYVYVYVYDYMSVYIYIYKMYMYVYIYIMYVCIYIYIRIHYTCHLLKHELISTFKRDWSAAVLSRRLCAGCPSTWSTWSTWSTRTRSWCLVVVVSRSETALTYPVISWFIIPLTIDISTISPSY